MTIWHLQIIALIFVWWYDYCAAKQITLSEIIQTECDDMHISKQLCLKYIHEKSYSFLVKYQIVFWIVISKLIFYSNYLIDY